MCMCVYYSRESSLEKSTHLSTQLEQHGILRGRRGASDHGQQTHAVARRGGPNERLASCRARRAQRLQMRQQHCQTRLLARENETRTSEGKTKKNQQKIPD